MTGLKNKPWQKRFAACIVNELVASMHGMQFGIFSQIWSCFVQIYYNNILIPLPSSFCQLYVHYLNPTMSRLSLLLHESKAKPRTSVNNNDNLQVQWDLSGFYPMLLMCMTMASVHRLPLFFEVICNLL